MQKTKKRAAPLVATLLAALLTIPAVYALLRTNDVLFQNEPNPATVIWSAHIAMFWRLLIGTYAAGMVAPLVFTVATRDLARTIKVLSVAALVVAAMIGGQGLLLP